MTDRNVELKNQIVEAFENNLVIDGVRVEDADKVESIRFAVTAAFLREYLSATFAKIREIDPSDESQSFGFTLIIDFFTEFEKKIGDVNKEGLSVAERRAILSGVLRNADSSSNILLDSVHLGVPLLDLVKSDFVVIADFIDEK